MQNVLKTPTPGGCLHSLSPLLERQKSEPFAQSGNWSAQSPNPLLKFAAGTPKVLTLCAKWQLKRPKSEPFAQTQKYEPFARNGSWSA